MRGGDDPAGFTARFQTRFYSTAIRRSDIQNGVCEVDGDSISLRAGTQSVAIAVDAITNLTTGTPPERFEDEDKVAYVLHMHSKTTSGGLKLQPSAVVVITFITHFVGLGRLPARCPTELRSDHRLR